MRVRRGWGWRCQKVVIRVRVSSGQRATGSRTSRQEEEAAERIRCAEQGHAVLPGYGAAGGGGGDPGPRCLRCAYLRVGPGLTRAWVNVRACGQEAPERPPESAQALGDKTASAQSAVAGNEPKQTAAAAAAAIAVQVLTPTQTHDISLCKANITTRDRACPYAPRLAPHLPVRDCC